MGMPGIIIKIGANTVDAVQGLNRVDSALNRNLTGAERMDRAFGAMKFALLGAAAAAGTFALKLGADAVQAAIEDERSLTSLNTTLKNMGFGPAATEVDGLIGRMQILYGVADTELRTAFDRLVRSTKDVGEAERALQIAMDISAGTGKDLETVSAALGKAYDGNTGALSKLGTGLDSAILKSGDMKAITEGLAQTFDGQAAAAADTFQGRLNVLSEAAGEASEQVGYALLGAMTDLADAMGGSDGAAEAIQTTGDELSTVIDLSTAAITKILELARVTEGLAGAQEDANAAGAGANGWVEYLISRIPVAGGAIVELMNGRQRESASSARNSGIVNVEALRYIGLANAARAAANALLASNAARANQAVTDRYSALAMQEYGKNLGYTGGNLSTYFDKVDKVNRTLSGGGNSTSNALDKVNPRLQKQIDVTQGHIEQLTGSDGYIAQLKALTDQQTSYANSVSSSILGGINLSSVFDKENLGGSVAAFTAQIGDVASFSTELGNLAVTLPKSAGAQALIAQIQGLGVENGRALLAGLTTETATSLAASLDAATLTVTGNATLLGGHFYGEGVAAAQQLVTAMTDQIVKDEAKLRAIGKQVGQPIGAEIKAAIVAAITEALGEAANAQAAAVAGAVASAAATITGDTYNFPSATVIDPVNVTRVLDTYKAQSRSRTGGP